MFGKVVKLEEKLNVSYSSRTDSDVLDKLAGDSNESVQVNVARNLNVNPETLKKLANNISSEVRINVASNSRTPVETLVMLAKDSDKKVRRQVAYNPNTPIQILNNLSKDEYLGVKAGVAHNTGTPKETLILLGDDTHELVREIVAANPNTPLETLVKLSKDSSSVVKLGLVTNPKTPAGILESFLTQDFLEHERVGFSSKAMILTRLLEKKPSLLVLKATAAHLEETGDEKTKRRVENVFENALQDLSHLTASEQNILQNFMKEKHGLELRVKSKGLKTTSVKNLKTNQKPSLNF